MRVVDELNEVRARLARLDAFILSPQFAAVAEDEKRRLAKQAAVMGEYEQVLADRVAHF